MPKLPTVERFKLSCEVEAANLGPTLAHLTKLGLTNLGFELITDVRRFNKNIKPDAPDAPEISTAELLAAWIKDHPTFKAIEAAKHLEANGLAKSTAYHALNTLVGKGILKKLEPGHYSRADVKHLAGPKKPKKAAKAAKPPRQNRYAINNSDFILRAGRRSHGRFNTTTLRKLFEADGRFSSSVSPTINALLTRKLVKRVGDGEYVLLTKSTKPKTLKPKSPAPPKSNGGLLPVAAPVEETGVADHG